MSFDIEKIHKSTGRVTKFLKKNARRPDSDAIHDLRTSARRIEATLSTLGFDSKSRVKRLLRRLAEVRTRAGEVRDMDVLTGAALTVRDDREQDCLVQLLEYLGAERSKCAQTLRQEVRKAGPKLRKELKRNSKRVEKVLKKAAASLNSDVTPTTIARALQLSSDLHRPVNLNKSNLHAYRLKVKELRNVLVSAQTGNEEFLDKLTEVKDAIGEWHDWEELIAIALQVLDHGAPCKLTRQMRATSKAKYERALELARDLRSNYLKPRKPKRGGRHGKTDGLSTPVLSAASAIAEK